VAPNYANRSDKSLNREPQVLSVGKLLKGIPVSDVGVEVAAVRVGVHQARIFPAGDEEVLVDGPADELDFKHERTGVVADRLEARGSNEGSQHSRRTSFDFLAIRHGRDKRNLTQPHPDPSSEARRKKHAQQADD